MKTLITLILLVSAQITVYGQLNSSAKYIKDNFQSEYQQTLRQHSIKKWDTDYEMVVYMINNQAESLFALIKAFETEHTDIATSAILKWSYDGYKSFNIAHLKKATTFRLTELIGLHCDWEMVKYEYDNQVSAKNSF